MELESTSASDLAGSPSSPANPDRFRWALVIILRGGVLFAAALLLIGMVLHFIGGSPLAIDAPAQRPHGVEGLASLTVGSPMVVLSYGLFVLISLPVARVGLSLVHFVRARDRLYSALTGVVLLVLAIGIVWGKAL